MKIAFDISKFSQGCYENSAKTGIYRYTSELLFQLLNRKKLNIHLTSHNFPHGITNALICLRNKDLEGQMIFRLSNIEKRLYPFLKKYQIPFNFQISLAAALLLQEFKSKSFSQYFDLFHSTYFPFPRFMTTKKTQRFITIHDMSSFIFPEYCTRSQIKRNKKILQDINIHKDWVLTVSKNTKKDFCEFTGMSQDRVFVSPLGADSKFYYPTTDIGLIKKTKQRFNIPENDYFLSLSTIEPRKNLYGSIRCFKKIVMEERFKHLSYVIVGNKGWKTDAIYQNIDHDPTLKKRVVFTGYVPDNYLSAIYSGALAFIYPSFYEGFGIPVLEAMQCGAPVITSKISSLPEVVGEAGVMIDPTDDDALCQAMIDMVQDKNNIRSKCSVLGLEQAKRFSWERCANQTVQAYRVALSNK